MKEDDFTLEFSKFHTGFAPAAHLNSLSELGGGAGAMVNADVLDPTYITQGPGLSTLTAGTEAGAVTELINFILDKPAISGLTYGIGNTKLQQISASAVTNTGIWPHAITGATEGNSVIEFQSALYYFYNKAGGGDFGKYDLSVTFDDDFGSTVPTGGVALQSAPHPADKKEDILLFGNGRYVGTFISSTISMNPIRLDFGANSEVADVSFFVNQWWIAVNSGADTTDRTSSKIVIYDGAALTSEWADEITLGAQRIGFIIPINGVMYICYRDLTGTNVFGYISGRTVKPLCYFTGALPTYQKKTLYKQFVLFESSGLIYAAGAATPDLPYALSQHADGGFTTCGALAAPFGTPMVASTQSTSFKLAKFSGFDVNASYRSIVIPTVNGSKVGQIDKVVILTKNLGSGARCDLQFLYNQLQEDSGIAKQITTGKRRHVLREFYNPPNGIEDLRLFLDWSNGSATNDCAIRKILVSGHYIEKP